MRNKFIILHTLFMVLCLSSSYAGEDDLCSGFTKLLQYTRDAPKHIYEPQAASDVPNIVSAQFPDYQFYPVKQQYKYYENFSKEYMILREDSPPLYIILIPNQDVSRFEGYLTTIGMASILCGDQGNYKAEKEENPTGDMTYNFITTNGTPNLVLAVHHVFLDEADTNTCIIMLLGRQGGN